VKSEASSWNVELYFPFQNGTDSDNAILDFLCFNTGNITPKEGKGFRRGRIPKVKYAFAKRQVVKMLSERGR
jgi:hypothetical protein